MQDTWFRQSSFEFSNGKNNSVQRLSYVLKPVCEELKPVCEEYLVMDGLPWQHLSLK